MAKPILTRKRAKIISVIVFIISLILVTYFQAWWPGIMLTLGLPLAIWQYLQGRIYDMCITLFVFVGAFITVQFEIRWEILLPVLFSIGGIYILFREWLESRSTEEEEFEEDKAEAEEDNEDED